MDLKKNLMTIAMALLLISQSGCDFDQSTSDTKFEALQAQNIPCQNRGSVSDVARCLWNVGKSDGGFISRRAENQQQCEERFSPNTVVIAPVGESSRLFCSVDSNIFSKPSFQALIRLFGHYIPDTRISEDVSRRQEVDIDNFLNEVLKTDVMKGLKGWLLQNRMITRYEYENFKDTLHEIWFTPIRRDTSSGFEHVFVGEVKHHDNTVGGYHSWVKYYLDELRSCDNIACPQAMADYVRNHAHSKKRLDRIMEHRSSPHRIVMESTWILDGQEFKKRVGGFFLGTTPETELAMGTLAYFNGNFSFFLDGQEEELRIFYHDEDDKRVIRTVF